MYYIYIPDRGLLLVILIMWNSIALASIVITEPADAMKYGEGVLYNSVFTEFPFKTVSGDVTALHRIPSQNKRTAIVALLLLCGPPADWPHGEAQNSCIRFIQWRPNVGPTLYKCYQNVLCLLGRRSLWCVSSKSPELSFRKWSDRAP